MTTSVSVSFAALSMDCADSAALADFWGKALGRPVSPGKVAGDTAVDATGPESGPRMLFHNIPEPKTGNNGFHLVLTTENYEEEIERLIGLGAKPLNETKLPQVRWTTLADPEGNAFDLANWQSA
jgi:predicted enzyme related to lactoylglutathione lyase